MKKLFFTAIAMIAFSSASMANTIADENEVIKINEKIEQQIQIQKVTQRTPMECLAGKLSVYNQSREYGLSPEQSSNNAYQWYFICMGEITFN